jgi:hypothetical protein
MNYGYIYCFSIPSREGVFNVGKTKQSPDEKLKEVNAFSMKTSGEFFTLEFAKRVLDPKQKEEEMHRLLSSIGTRIFPNRKFFKVSREQVYGLFKLMDGKLWKPEISVEPPREKEEEEGSVEIEDEQTETDMTDYDPEEYLRLTRKMFPRWSKKVSVISEFMYSIRPDTVYTLDQLKEIMIDCGTIPVAVIHVMRYKYGNVSYNGWGQIMQPCEGGFRLYPCLVKEFNKYFYRNKQ